MDELILIVDDAKFARNLMKRALANGGYENLREASTAVEAKLLFQELHPALTILDITLTDNTDLTLLGQLLQCDPTARIVVNSAIGQPKIIAEALALGAKNFITKPFEERDLLNIVRTVLQGEEA